MKRIPIKVYDEEGNETTKEVLYRSMTDENTGMVEWQMEPGQDFSGRRLRVKPNLRFVSLGGGTGQPVVLRGLKHYVFGDAGRSPLDPLSRQRLTAIVSMTDDGGSSGRLREELNMLPPGDVRNCLVGLSENENLMTRLLKYRFEGENGLSGHSLGNLILTALSEIHQNFFRAVSDISSVLAIKGRILPSTIEPAVLQAELLDGSVIQGETNINQCPKPIRRVRVHPEQVRPLEEAVCALERADGIIIGPGSLYTSILPNLMIQGVAEAIQRSSAVTVLVANLMTEPEETRGFTISDHLRVIAEHLGFQIVDHALINTAPLPEDLRRRYEQEGATATRYDTSEIQALGVNPVEADLLEQDTEKVRHDPMKLARKILGLFQEDM